MLRKFSNLKGLKVEGKDDELGKIKDFYFDQDYFILRYLVVDTGSWLKSRKTLISTAALENIDYQTKKLRVNLNTEALKDAPSLKKNKPVSQIKEQNLAEYFNWPMYWVPPYSNSPGVSTDNVMRGKIPSFNNLTEEEKEIKSREQESNLRSFDEIKGYHIKAKDKEFGNLEDLFVDEENWLIRYLLIDTCNFLPCKNVLLSPEWIKNINWREKNISIDKTKEQIKNAPEYKEEKTEYLVHRDYEKDLYDHYNEEKYWRR